MTRSEVIEKHQGLVGYVVGQYTSRKSVEPADLFGVGMLGLIKAVDLYDPSRGASFATFAVPRIRGEIQHYFRDKSWLVRSPSGMRLLLERYQPAEEALEASLGRAPRSSEIADKLGVPERSVEDVESVRLHYSGINGVAPDAEDRMALASGLDRGLEAVPELVDLKQALDTLSQLHRQVVVGLYYRGETQAEVAERIGISQMTVSRLKQQATTTLRTALSP